MVMQIVVVVSHGRGGDGIVVMVVTVIAILWCLRVVVIIMGQW